ncbi:MAG: hypothetical protein HQ592_13810 [Planctomycetes bacterium]|nr:hypothetical protein [Planctomycetota bacterium]
MSKTSGKTRQWRSVGWQGIRFLILSAWHVARVQGERTEGYLRVDDDDDGRVRLELRWMKPLKRPKSFDVVADSMIAQLDKFSRKKRLAFTTKRRVRVASPPGREYECFETRGEVVSYGCLMRCRTCGRTVLVRVLGLPREDLKTLAKKIFETLTDHPGEDGLDCWDVYDLKFALPPSYMLQGTKLRTGALEMRFTDKKTELDIRRIGLGAVLLKDRTLESFVMELCYKELRPFDVQTAKMDVHGHEGLGITGPMTFRSRMLSNTGRKRYVHVHAWVCDDRIYVFRMTSREREDPLFFELSGRVQCH